MSSTSRKKAWGVSVPMPAPGDLREVQEFVGTWSADAKKDPFATPSALALWMESQGLLPARSEITEGQRRRVVAFRQGLRALIWADDGERVDEKTVEGLHEVIEGARLEVRFGLVGEPRVDAVGEGIDRAIARLLSVVVNAYARGEWSRLKICHNPECRTVYYDDSRSRARKWCTRRCGDVMRSRAFRRTPRYQRLYRGR